MSLHFLVGPVFFWHCYWVGKNLPKQDPSFATKKTPPPPLRPKEKKNVKCPHPSHIIGSITNRQRHGCGGHIVADELNQLSLTGGD